MNDFSISRRGFLISGTAAGVGLSIGFLPALSDGAMAAAGPNEVTAWAVIDEDDTVTIRIARSEMGQGLSLIHI